MVLRPYKPHAGSSSSSSSVTELGPITLFKYSLDGNGISPGSPKMWFPLPETSLKLDPRTSYNHSLSCLVSSDDHRRPLQGGPANVELSYSALQFEWSAQYK